MGALHDLLHRYRWTLSQHATGHLNGATFDRRSTEYSSQCRAVEALGENVHIDQNVEVPLLEIVQLSVTIGRSSDDFRTDASLAKQFAAAETIR